MEIIPPPTYSPGAQTFPFDEESEQNLVGFYNLLLTIDKRVNPQLYD